MRKKTYQTLSKVLRQQLREKRVSVSQARAQEEAIKKNMQTLEDQLSHERTFVQQTPHFQSLFETFKKDLYHKQTHLSQQRKILDRQLRDLQDHLNKLFCEMKSYEIPVNRFQKQLQYQEERAEQKRLDETGGTIFCRREPKKPLIP